MSYPVNEQTRNIMEMESRFLSASGTLKEMSELLERFRSAQALLSELESYYTSPQWRRDYEDDEAKKMPELLRRGVLSQDGIYNLLEQNKELLSEMEELIANAKK